MICFFFFLFCSSYLWIHYKHKCDVGFKGSTIILRGSEILCSRIWFVSIKIWVVSLHITARKQNRTDYRPIWFVFKNACIAHELSKCWCWSCFIPCETREATLVNEFVYLEINHQYLSPFIKMILFSHSTEAPRVFKCPQNIFLAFPW